MLGNPFRRRSRDGDRAGGAGGRGGAGWRRVGYSFAARGRSPSSYWSNSGVRPRSRARRAEAARRASLRSPSSSSARAPVSSWSADSRTAAESALLPRSRVPAPASPSRATELERAELHASGAPRSACGGGPRSDRRCHIGGQRHRYRVPAVALPRPPLPLALLVDPLGVVGLLDEGAAVGGEGREACCPAPAWAFRRARRFPCPRLRRRYADAAGGCARAVAAPRPRLGAGPSGRRSGGVPGRGGTRCTR